MLGPHSHPVPVSHGVLADQIPIPGSRLGRSSGDRDGGRNDAGARLCDDGDERD